MLLRSSFRPAGVLLCFGLFGCGGGSSPSPSPSPAPSGPPTVTLSPASANGFVGQTVTLTWTSTNATSCMSSGAWNGPLATSGTQSVTPSLAGTQTYSITCTGSGGTANASSTVTTSTPAVSITNDFSPNGVTISTSEGAPYGFEDLWQLPRGVRLDTQYGYGPTKVTELYICLSGQVNFGRCSAQPDVTGPLSPQMLAGIDAGIASFARSGVRLLIRFIYNFGPTAFGRDAPIDLISTHIDQLAPILLKNRDLIFALEAGFIGTWGEWHHSSNGNDTAAAHKVVLDKELSYFKGVFPILVRYPAAIIAYSGSSTPPDGLGIHDDFYASGDRDGGTWDPCRLECLSNYTDSQLMTFGEQISMTSMFVAEFGALFPSLQDCAALDAYSYRFHLQSITLHIDATPTVADLLDRSGCLTSLLNKAGTRIELQRAALIGNSGAGGSLSVTLTMVNGGYGRVIRARPVSLVFLSSGSVVGQVPISLQDLDLRQLVGSSPATPKTFQFTTTLPSSLPAGRPITVALLVPDPAPSLSAQAAYALPLNSLDSNGRAIFDSTTGYNTIGAFTSGATGQGNNLVQRPIYAIAQPQGLTGNWSGESTPSASANGFISMRVLPSNVQEAVARLQGTPRIAWSLKQDGATVTGTASVTIEGAMLLSGTLTGTFANGALSYIVSVPTGGASIAPECEGQIQGLANLTSTLLVGSAAVRTSTCIVPLSNITFTLTKQ